MKNEQLSFLPSIYDCNMRKKKIWNWYQEKKMSEEKLHFLLETLEMMMELDMGVTTELDWSLYDYLQEGAAIDKKYIYYALETCHTSLLSEWK